MIVTTIGLLLAFMAGFFCAIKSVQLGLRWQIQTQAKQEPTLQNPIQPIIEQKQADKQEQFLNKAFDEWMNGAKG